MKEFLQDLFFSREFKMGLLIGSGVLAVAVGISFLVN